MPRIYMVGSNSYIYGLNQTLILIIFANYKYWDHSNISKLQKKKKKKNHSQIEKTSKTLKRC